MGAKFKKKGAKMLPTKKIKTLSLTLFTALLINGCGGGMPPVTVPTH